jgi:nitric oxide synthase-interacting protein
MTRHARNSTAGSVYTYHEKQRDKRESGFGTEKARLSKLSLKNFDCCSISYENSIDNYNL